VITIYDFPNGARGLRAAWLCEEMALSYAFVPVGFPPDDSFRELNPFGTVPFLQDDGVSMSESIAMMFYIAQKYGPTEALPPVEDERFAKVLQFTLLGEASLSSLITPLLAVRSSPGSRAPSTELAMNSVTANSLSVPCSPWPTFRWRPHCGYGVAVSAKIFRRR
jgi:glutathione S-transferase